MIWKGLGHIPLAIPECMLLSATLTFKSKSIHTFKRLCSLTKRPSQSACDREAVWSASHGVEADDHVWSPHQMFVGLNVIKQVITM